MESKEDNPDRLIKKNLEDKVSRINLSLENCPSELELSDYLENRLTPEKEDILLEHLSECRHCLSLLTLAQEAAKKESGDRPTPQMLARAKSIFRKRPKKTIFHYKWQILAFVSFALSFLFSRYFLQFLVLAVIFSLKWLLDTGSTRTLIMIYDAWRKKDKGDAQRIARDFQDKTEHRR